jgi:hypothetical protein
VPITSIDAVCVMNQTDTNYIYCYCSSQRLDDGVPFLPFRNFFATLRIFFSR